MRTGKFDWATYKAADFWTLDANRIVAILPVAAIEQHGPHLPVGVDAMIGEGLLSTVCNLARDHAAFRILPMQAVGKSDEHLFAPGTLSLDACLAINAWTALGESVARTGLKKMIIVSSHGGNNEVVGIVARRLRVAADMLVAKCNWSDFGFPDGLLPKEEIEEGIHGGEIETSLMLHFQPEFVNLADARYFPNRASMRERDRILKFRGGVSYGWTASDLNEHGVVGHAERATAEKGRLIAEHQARAFLKVIDEMQAVSIPLNVASR